MYLDDKTEEGPPEVCCAPADFGVRTRAACACHIFNFELPPPGR